MKCGVHFLLAKFHIHSVQNRICPNAGVVRMLSLFVSLNENDYLQHAIDRADMFRVWTVMLYAQ
jgi:hypothetical protein